MGPTLIQGRSRWLQPERRWKGGNALVPVETCYRILDLFLWLSALLGALGVGMAYLRGPELLGRSPLFWLVCLLLLPVVLSAVFRGWPFNVRYGLMTFFLFVYSIASSMELGITPNWAFFIIILVATTSLLQGARAGFAMVTALSIGQAVVAWGWVTGRLPAFLPDVAAAHVFMDFTATSVWIRVLVVGAGLQAGLILLMRYVLRDLNEALKQANSTLHKLAVEQEYRAQAEEGRLKAGLALREAQKFDALGRMASGVAHDFNNALCVMKGWSSILLEETKDPLVRDAMGDIKRATDNAAQLTHHLLAFGRSDPAKREVVNLTDMVQLEAKTLRRLLPPDVEVTADTGGPVYVRLGSGQLQEIILNLAINARDAMPQGGRLTLRITEEAQTTVAEGRAVGRYTCLAVTDTGTGMDEATQAHIFEPFFTTKAPGKGTGLGLAMVYGLVTGAGGWVDVESEIGRGTTFRLRFPVVTAADIHIEPPVTAVENPIRCRVLVADGQTEIRSLVERILVREGFPVIVVADGAEALAALQGEAGRFGMLVVEGIMPGAPTMEIIERALAGNPDCRVIIASAHLPDRLLQRGIEAGRYSQLAKPFDAGQLREAVNLALGKQVSVPAVRAI